MNNGPKFRGKFTSLSVYYFLFAAGMSCYVAFVTMWQNSIGYSKLLIGALSSGSALVAVVLQPVFSLAADRSRTKNFVLKIMLAVQATMAFLHMVPGSWLYVLCVMSALTAFQSAALGLSNAIILDSLGSEGDRGAFGNIRVRYSWGYAIAGAAAGLVSSRSTTLVFLLCGLVNLAALAASFRLPVAPGFQSRRRRMGIKSLFRYHEFWALIGYSLAIHITHSLAIAFLPVYFSSLGAPGWVYGIGVFIMAASETPFLLLSGRLMERFSVRSLLLVPGVAFALRWFLTSWATAWWQLLALYALQGLGIIIIYVGLARYVSDRLPKELSATGQGVVNSVVISGSRVVGALLGGFLATWLGLSATFFWMGLMSLLALAALLAANLMARRRAGGSK